MVHHLQKWRCYLEGRHFVVVTDHEPNTWFNEQMKLSPRQNRRYENWSSTTSPGNLGLAESTWLTLLVSTQHLLQLWLVALLVLWLHELSTKRSCQTLLPRRGKGALKPI